ncbi:histidine kinase [Niastella yeongjuensis]|uniref:Histidine kinase n=1 Tax=Niastella yeongjuensis TaxID=354355 RepID=A0A1V9EFS4_9BACT|nr:histidine kinase [Niastella yeongjuensis]OQP44804.1 histidine kinase [Niastella yeongjuensis]SEP42291.1 Histidine kinase [Niastella yeongjuensis]
MSIVKINRHWLIKYKLYHLPFWCLYHYVWWVVALGNPLKAASAMIILPYAIKFSFYVGWQAIAVYFNLYYLIPRFLEKSRFTLYISCLLITILGTASLIVTGYYLGAFVTGKSFEALYGPGNYCLYYFYSIALPSTLASTTLAMSIKLTKNWIQTKRRQQLLEKENLETELNFLKNQYNPHFLFNTINSIFFLIHKNPDKASVSLAKFSELLRYQLYECNEGQIPVNREIMYLENAVELERLRLNSHIKVNSEVSQVASAPFGIAPFILMTFVENAFKHVSKQPGERNWISVKLHIRENQLDFFVGNSTSYDTYTPMTPYKGIGLKNVQRRLDLIYPGKYNLDIQCRPHSYEVALQIQLSALPAPAGVNKIAPPSIMYK